MQRGKWFLAKLSMVLCVIGAPGMAVSASERVESGVPKDFERCVKMGVSRSSSSRRGRAREVS